MIVFENTRMSRKGAFVAFAVLTLEAMTASQATEFVNDRRIASIGCHATTASCYVTLDGASFGSGEGCTSGATNEFRWDDADAANGQRAYSSMLAAYLQQNLLNVTINGCSSQGWPKLSTYRLK